MRTLVLCAVCLTLLGSAPARSNPVGPAAAPAPAASGEAGLLEEQAHLQSLSSQLSGQGSSGGASGSERTSAGGSRGFNLVNVNF